LKQHGEHHPHVIFDDKPLLHRHLVRTDHYDGLQSVHIEAALAVLRSQGHKEGQEEGTKKNQGEVADHV